jgi:hypothetical protein
MTINVKQFIIFKKKSSLFYQHHNETIRSIPCQEKGKETGKKAQFYYSLL